MNQPKTIPKNSALKTSTAEKHANYSWVYHDKDAALYYQRKFNRSLSSWISSAREKRIVAKALAEAGRLVGKKPSELTLLDYPCGAGRFAPLLASRVQGYLAGDHSPQMVELTVQTLRDHKLSDIIIGTTTGDLKKSTLDDSCVDLAASIRLLHHFHKKEDRISILSELRRISRGPLITTFRDAGSIKHRRHLRKREKAGKPCTRFMQSIPEFTQEAQEAGWKHHKSWQISSAFSGTCIALLTPA